MHPADTRAPRYVSRNTCQPTCSSLRVSKHLSANVFLGTSGTGPSSTAAGRGSFGHTRGRPTRATRVHTGWCPGALRARRGRKQGGDPERRGDAGSRDCHMYRPDRVSRTASVHREEVDQVLEYDRYGARSGGGPELREDEHGASFAQSDTPSKDHSSSPWSPESGKYVGSSQEEVFREKHQVEAHDLLPMFDADAGKEMVLVSVFLCVCVRARGLVPVSVFLCVCVRARGFLPVCR